MSQGNRINSTIKITDNEMNTIEGTLTIPDRGTHTKGIVIFAHGSGSSRFSPRNKYVAQTLNRTSIATLLIDLLTPEEERVDDITREYRFDISLLGDLSLVQIGLHKILKSKISKSDILVPAPVLLQH